ncbi:MAG: hypothetical protein LBC09_05170 [Helicobacteraceae bacterium]|jgi:hypothetical protein|nr:hypothetical protein [Helicobacteraceae bacterium]
MSKNRILAWIAAIAVVAAIGYYFSFVYEKADYQHPRIRSGSTGLR